MNGTYGHLQQCEDYCHASGTMAPPERHVAPTHAGHISTGTLLLIVVVFGLWIPYVLLGMAYNKCVVGAVGYEIMPHHQFWSELPGYVTRGFTATAEYLFGESSQGYTSLQ